MSACRKSLKCVFFSCILRNSTWQSTWHTKSVVKFSTAKSRPTLIQQSRKISALHPQLNQFVNVAERNVSMLMLLDVVDSSINKLTEIVSEVIAPDKSDIVQNAIETLLERLLVCSRLLLPIITLFAFRRRLLLTLLLHTCISLRRRWWQQSKLLIKLCTTQTRIFGSLVGLVTGTIFALLLQSSNPHGFSAHGFNSSFWSSRVVRDQSTPRCRHERRALNASHTMLSICLLQTSKLLKR